MIPNLPLFPTLRSFLAGGAAIVAVILAMPGVRADAQDQQPGNVAEAEVEADSGTENADVVGGADYIAEAELPAGFPGPGPVEEVVRKTYPRYRAARARSGDSPDGGGAFWKLFNHIQTHQVAMTAPVEMRMKPAEDDGAPLRQETMAFLYERPDQGDAGKDGDVEVVDYPPLEVLSIAFLGNPGAERVATLTEKLRRQLPDAGRGRAEAGMRVLGYNSPMVPENRRLYEVQLILGPAQDEPSADDSAPAAQD